MDFLIFFVLFLGVFLGGGEFGILGGSPQEIAGNNTETEALTKINTRRSFWEYFYPKAEFLCHSVNINHAENSFADFS